MKQGHAPLETITGEYTKLLPRQSHRFICNPAVRPDVSGLAMIREDLLKPIKDAVA